MKERFIINPKNQVLMKKSFVLRLDDEMYKLLEKWAADEFRSVNGQLEYIINQSLINSGRKKNKTDNKSTDKK